MNESVIIFEYLILKSIEIIHSFTEETSQS